MKKKNMKYSASSLCQRQSELFVVWEVDVNNADIHL